MNRVPTTRNSGNMIYIGDGITDIPCFSLLNEKGGISFGIFHSEKTASQKIKIFTQICKSKRTLGTYAPKYGKSDNFGDLIRLTIEQKCSEILVRRQSAGI